jgi:hypothetical protein
MPNEHPAFEAANEVAGHRYQKLFHRNQRNKLWEGRRVAVQYSGRRHGDPPNSIKLNQSCHI